MHENETMYKNHMMWVLNYIALPQVFSYPPQKTLMSSPQMIERTKSSESFNPIRTMQPMNI